MTVAFFDMDETLLGVNSAHLWVKYLWREGELSALELARTMGWMVGYKLAIVDVRRLAVDAVSRLEGEVEAELRETVERWYADEVSHHVIPEMVARVEDHRRRGHETVLLTASSPYVAEACRAQVGLDDALSTRFEVEGGRFTGRLHGPMCYGSGKVEIAEEWAQSRGKALDDAWFYSDSYTDLPMLQRVENPVATNPVHDCCDMPVVPEWRSSISEGEGLRGERRRS